MDNILLFDCKSLTSILFSIQSIQIQQPGIWGMYYKEQIQYHPYPDSGTNQRIKHSSVNEFIKNYKKKRDTVSYTILLGSKNETNTLINEIRSPSDIIFCYEPEFLQQHTGNTIRETEPQHTEINLRQLLSDITESVNVSQKSSLQAIEKSINDLRAIVNGLQQSRTTLVVPERSNNDAVELKKTVGNMAETLRQTHYFAEELYNNMPTSANNSGSETRIEELKKELANYKNDFYLKVSLPYVNSAIEMLCIMYEDLNSIGRTEGPDSSSFERMRRVISASEVYVKRLNVQIRTSNSGDNWDPHSMRAYDDRVATEQEELKGHVAYSISPAFFWVMPRVNAPGANNLLLREEIVALYE